MNNQFEQNCEKSIRTELWTINLNRNINLNGKINNHFDQNYQQQIKKKQTLKH